MDVGESCLNRAHVPRNITAMKTFVHSDGQVSTFEQCTNKFHVTVANTSYSLFQITKNDNKPSLSVEDQQFIEIMSTEMQRDDNNKLVAPLPFKPNRDQIIANKLLIELGLLMHH